MAVRDLAPARRVRGRTPDARLRWGAHMPGVLRMSGAKRFVGKRSTVVEHVVSTGLHLPAAMRRASPDGR